MRCLRANFHQGQRPCSHKQAGYICAVLLYVCCASFFWQNVGSPYIKLLDAIRMNGMDEEEYKKAQKELQAAVDELNNLVNQRSRKGGVIPEAPFCSFWAKATTKSGKC